MGGRRASCCSAPVGGPRRKPSPRRRANSCSGPFLRRRRSRSAGGWVRQGYIWNVVDGKLVDDRELQMRTSLAAALRLGPLRAEGELGYASAKSARTLPSSPQGDVAIDCVSEASGSGDDLDALGRESRPLERPGE